jgi:dual specificity MAP kinase phosphatase
MITDNIAIGNYLSSYEPFDVVVNLCFPQNAVEHRQIAVSTYPSKTIIRIGINDDPSESMDSLLPKIIVYLVSLYHQNPNLRILFHCYAGISRSTTVAIAYMTVVYGMKLEDAYNLVKSRRPFIQPNPGFMEALKNFVKN